MTFEKALGQVKKGDGTGMRRPHWGNGDVRCQNPLFNGPCTGAGMTAPYLYMSDRLGNIPWIPSMRDLFADDWEIVEW